LAFESAVVGAAPDHETVGVWANCGRLGEINALVEHLTLEGRSGLRARFAKNRPEFKNFSGNQSATIRPRQGARVIEKSK
jgi:hypothetical protein